MVRWVLQEERVNVMLIIVLVRIVTAVLLSVWQKVLAQRGAHPAAIVFGMYLFTAVLGAPTLGWLEPRELRPGFWTAVGWAGMLDALGNVFLLLSLRVTDLSIFGPLNAYKSVFALLVSYLVLGEIPSPVGVLGVIVITGSSLLLFWPTRSLPQGSSQSPWLSLGVGFRLLGILFFVLGSTYLKISALSGPLWFAFYGWCVIGAFVSGVAWLGMCSEARRAPLLTLCREWRGGWHAFVGIAVLNAGMQLATLHVLRETLVGYAMALFQLGVILHVVAGRAVFREQDVVRRLLAAVGMFGGSLLILRFG